MKKKVYAISDIHGCNATFNSLLDKLNLNKSDKLYLLGDYIDRGPDSKGVVDTIIKLKKNDYKVFCLKGNHDVYVYSKPGTDEWYSWLLQGGQETLESFGIETFSEIKPKYRAFFDSLSYYTEHKDFLLVHAGFDFSLKDPFENKKAMLWIRNMKYDAEKVNYKRIIHGHTPQPMKAALKAYKKNNQLINIDFGCVYKKKKGMGYLCSFELNSNSFLIQKNIDDF